MKQNKLYINEEQVLSLIEKVIRENRKVLKLGNAAPSAPAAPSMPEPMPQDMGMGQGMGQDMGMEGGDMQQPQDMPMGDDMQNGGEQDNQFDTNFDAGVEADEETDPKHYIQQLTGKLSQSLNSFNSEQGGDPGLSKYVASMIVVAACKSLDDKAKKEIIEKINSASNDEEMPTDDDNIGDEGMEDSDMGDMQNVPDEQMPMNENVYTKKQIFEMFNNLDDTEERPVLQDKNLGKRTPKAWKSKF